MASVHPSPSKAHPEAHKVRYRFADGRAGATNFPDRAQADQFARMIDDYGLTEALARVNQPLGPKRIATGSTVDQCLERYIAQRPNPDTRDKYRRTARLHISPTLGKIRINRLTPEDVQLWLNALDGTGHYIEHVHMVLKVALAAAVARGEIKTNPARKASRVAQDGVRMPRTRSKRQPVFLDRDEYALVLKSIPRRYQTFVEFLADTGCRLGEATALTPADVNLDTGKVRFNKSYSRRSADDGGSRPFTVGNAKTETSEREIAVPQRILERLDLSGEFVFMNSDRGPINGDSFRCNVWNPAVEASGLPRHRQPRIHDIRHTHASWLLDAGLSLPAIQKRLGHADVMTTLAMYGHAATDSEDRILAALEGL
jgi:integrase